MAAIRFVLLGMILFAVTVQAAWAQGGRGPRGRGPRNDVQFRADRELFHFLLENRKKIRREVTNRENGVETLTESDDPQVAAKIQEHVASMYGRMKDGNPIHRRDPLFDELFRHSTKVQMKTEKTEKGIKVTESSDDPYVVRLIQSHAHVVSLFLKNGFSEVAKDHAILESSSADPAAGRQAAKAGSNEGAGGNPRIDRPLQKVVLGSAELTAGIPGKGPLTTEQIQKWLDDPRNHEPLELELPVGLNVLPNRLQKLTKPITRAKIELGRQLFFDPRLSADNTVSCASCHDPDHGYTVNQRFATGIKGQTGKRNPPTLFNRIMFGGIGEEEFWDGHAANIEDAILVAITDPTEMGNSLEGLMKTLRSTPGYRRQFESIYGKVTIAAVGDAVASLVRCLVTGPSPFDYYRDFERFADDDPQFLKEDDPELFTKYERIKADMEAHPMSNAARRGMDLYFGNKAWCSSCHATPALTDNNYHNIGIGMDSKQPDLGRYLVTGRDKDRGAFKTPPVRNAALTAPYMHDGSLATLEDVIDWYAKGGHPNPQLSDKFREVKIEPQEKADLVEFMKACTGELPMVERGRLPK